MAWLLRGATQSKSTAADDEGPLLFESRLEALRLALLAVVVNRGPEQGQSEASAQKVATPVPLAGQQRIQMTSVSSCLNDSSTFLRVICHLGLESLVKTKHRTLVASLEEAARQEDAPTGGGRRKRSRTGSSTEDKKATATAPLNLDDIEVRALQLRPRVLRARLEGLGFSSNSTASVIPNGGDTTTMGCYPGTEGTSFTKWIESLPPSDISAALEFVGVHQQKHLMNCIGNVGLVVWWYQFGVTVALLCGGRKRVIEGILRQLVTEESRWTASLLQCLCAPYDCPSPPARTLSAKKKDTLLTVVSEEDTEGECEDLLHIEGLAQFLFPCEVYHDFIDVFLSPSSATLAGCTTTQRLVLMGQLCEAMAPYLCSNVWSGMDVTRGAKYYPAARLLLTTWKSALGLVRPH